MRRSGDNKTGNNLSIFKHWHRVRVWVAWRVLHVPRNTLRQSRRSNMTGFGFGAVQWSLVMLETRALHATRRFHNERLITPHMLDIAFLQNRLLPEGLRRGSGCWWGERVGYYHADGDRSLARARRRQLQALLTQIYAPAWPQPAISIVARGRLSAHLSVYQRDDTHLPYPLPNPRKHPNHICPRSPGNQPQGWKSEYVFVHQQTGSLRCTNGERCGTDQFTLIKTSFIGSCFGKWEFFRTIILYIVNNILSSSSSSSSSSMAIGKVISQSVTDWVFNQEQKLVNALPQKTRQFSLIVTSWRQFAWTCHVPCTLCDRFSSRWYNVLIVACADGIIPH